MDNAAGLSVPRASLVPMNAEPTVEKVKLRIRFRPSDDLPAGEFLWATPLDAHDGGGRYELGNCAYGAWLAPGDLVRAEVDGDGNLQVVDILEPGDGILTAGRFTEEHAEVARSAGDAWRAHGAAWSEGAYGVLKTIWTSGVGWDEIEAAVAPYVERGALEWLGGAAPEDRARHCHPDVDFELDRTQHVADVDTTYWAADDPFWREHDMDDPEFLAYVQTVATQDEEIARALEKGDHEPLFRLLSWLGDQ